jgi:hypothetical protein
MPPHFPAAYFPESVWRGTSVNKEHRYDFVDPNPEDYNRIASEIIALETYLTTPFPYADFQVDAAAPPWSEGRVFYDSEEKTFAIYNNEPDVTLQLGQEIYLRATNKTGVKITNGELCYVNGAQGNRPTVVLAKADFSATAKVLAIATHDIDDNATGFFTVFGLVRGLNTDSFTEGDTLYLSDSVAGTFTNIPPSAPSFPIQIGVVIRKSIGEGAILISVGPTDVVGTIVIHDLDVNTSIDVAESITITHDGTDALFSTDKTTPSDLLIDCGVNKTLEIVEAAWDDIRFPVTSGRTGVSNPPTLLKFIAGSGSSVGVFTFVFADEAVEGNEEQVWFQVQLPHSWKEGTEIEPHVHWAVNADGSSGEFPKFGLEFAWVNIGELYSVTTTIVTDASTAGAATTSGDDVILAYKHYISDFPGIDGTGRFISSMLMCRFFRNSSHADDDLADGVFVLELDFHYQINTFGSRQEYIK